MYFQVNVFLNNSSCQKKYFKMQSNTIAIILSIIHLFMLLNVDCREYKFNYKLPGKRWKISFNRFFKTKSFN